MSGRLAGQGSPTGDLLGVNNALPPASGTESA